MASTNTSEDAAFFVCSFFNLKDTNGRRLDATYQPRKQTQLNCYSEILFLEFFRDFTFTWEKCWKLNQSISSKHYSSKKRRKKMPQCTWTWLAGGLKVLFYFDNKIVYTAWCVTVPSHNVVKHVSDSSCFSNIWQGQKSDFSVMCVAVLWHLFSVSFSAVLPPSLSFTTCLTVLTLSVLQSLASHKMHTSNTS